MKPFLEKPFAMAVKQHKFSQFDQAKKTLNSIDKVRCHIHNYETHRQYYSYFIFSNI